MNIQHYSFKDNLRLQISIFSEKYLKFPRKTIGYTLSFIVCKVADVLLRGSEQINKSVGGVNYQLDTRDLVGFRLFYFGCNENHIFKYLQNQIGEQKTILWDIGANIGSVSFPLINACPNLKVHAFEPSPPVFARLKRNVSLNSFSNLHIHQLALGETCGSIEFFVSSKVSNSGVGSFASTLNSSSKPVQVDCLTGDFVIENKVAPQPAFIKIDVEGFEYEVLLGMSSLLKMADNLQIIFEHEPYRLKERGIQPDQITTFLGNLGFEIYRISHAKSFYKISQHSLEAFNSSMLKDKCDFVAVRKSSQ
ncbi:MAG: FkbM family methyltransferase [Desmonostoc vinosum HA7617-LM4]|jgi:FkbM family methyltransferase|nr:FkbM family methyltransferase [Desmonostoc vinosum HA7617-LM4]